MALSSAKRHVRVRGSWPVNATYSPAYLAGAWSQRTPTISATTGSGDTIYANSPSLIDVSAAIANAEAGDKVIVPAGSSNWGTNQLVVTKAIVLEGNGIGSTVISSSFSDIFSGTILYSPSTPALNDLFRLTGFEILNTAGPCFTASSPVAYPTRVRVHGCKMDSTNTRTFIIFDPIYGVADNNQFRNEWAFCFSAFGANEATWAARNFAHGSIYNFYWEDNTCTVTDGFMEGGSGGRYCFRYNTITNTTGPMYPLLDLHGNMGSGGNLATMGAEIYGNTVNMGNNGGELVAYRGGRLLCYNNAITSSGTVWGGTIYEEVNDNVNPPATSPDGQPQYPGRGYFWGNRLNSSSVMTAGAVGGSGYEINYGGAIGVVPTENSTFWNEDTSFNGTSGVGVGTIAARPSTCTAGVGYWATDENKFYRATATNTWTLYYTPYTYPHPLRS